MPEHPWRPPPAHLPLARGGVEVWRADLGDHSRGEALFLSGAEQERAERFLRREDAERWALARGILRALLGRYADADPRSLLIVEGADGKPELAGDDSVRFNVSHSGDVALYALSLDHDVGVDVELPRRAVDHVAIARRTFGDAEAERLAALDPVRRQREFLRAWARWEAMLKCHGVGIGGAAAAADLPAPWICELEMEPPAAAALAVAGGPCPVRCWRWPPARA